MVLPNRTALDYCLHEKGIKGKAIPPCCARRDRGSTIGDVRAERLCAWAQCSAEPERNDVDGAHGARCPILRVSASQQQ
eukprot:6207772-Pleurochrysis_carterae.AAC.1